MKSYLFFLGQNQALSLAEITAIIPELKPIEISPNLVRIDSEDNLKQLGNRLGGTIKIAELVKKSDQSKLAADLVDLIISQNSKNFSFHLLNQVKAESFGFAASIKKTLTEKNFKSRFIATSSTGLSPLIITKQKVTELIIDPETQEIYLTIWVHSFKDWIIRDRKKPFVTPKSGMLPPKLARIMVNLAIGTKNLQETTLLDPFCGTGTILMEAAVLGAKIIGSDLSKEKINGTKANLGWLQANFADEKISTPTLIEADATNLSHKLEKNNIDVIATEPTLGPPSPDDKKLANLSRGLQKLYLGALKDWSRFLKPGSRLVIAFPIFHGRDRSFFTSNFIDARENLGYNILRNDLIFTRPGAKIERQIVILERN